MYEKEIKVLEIINKEGIFSQRQLSKLMGVSLGKTNSLVQELVSKNLISMVENEEGKAYLLTKKGEGVLEEHLKSIKDKRLNIHAHGDEVKEITQGVILAAGKREDFDKPVCFLELEEKLIIERAIDLLIYNGIKKIVIVTGYKKEFFKDIEEKYREVQLVENEKYKWTGTMSSLAKVQGYIDDDFILVESDLVFEERAINSVLKDENRDCILITEESGSEDEAFVQMQNGYLYKMSKDIHQFNKIHGEMIGISKISYKVFVKMLEEFKGNRNPYLNYEYMLLDIGRNYNIGCVKINDLVWAEVDFESHYQRLIKDVYPRLKRKEAEVRISYVKEKAANALEVNEDEVQEVVPIGGMTNKNFKITVNKKDYVLRLPGPGTSNMINRKHEMENARIASSLGVDSEIVYFSDETGIKVSKFIENSSTLNPSTARRQENMKLISSILKELHSSSVQFPSEFDVFEKINLYEDLLRDKNKDIFNGYHDVRKKVLKLKEFLKKLGAEMKPSHNDTVPENFVKSGENKIYLIDWEYSGMNDPMWDLAAHFLECGFTEDEEELFLYLYFGSSTIEENYKIRIFVHKILQDFLWSIWAKIKEESGEDLRAYGEDRFNRAKNNLRVLEEKYGNL